ncbi:unnamed protein product [Prunus armeniaca]|uniref:Uncharacterized protein n=1 Tax=Prunus armeniaca TaxID=36596 RepID=A0A6J5W7D4_PRUAR|nr:unnamed protein product [Prunus armeniaca]
MPVLQWAYGLDKPSYVDVLRLSELRSQSRDDKFNWASDSYLLIWTFPPSSDRISHECHCESCLVKEEFSKDALPEWIDWQQKKEIVLGFGIVNKDLSALLSEPDEFGGFTLIRLMSSGKLELQRYCASFDSFRSSPTTSVLNDISLPASIHEVVLKRLWSDLPIELLQLAFSNNSEILEVLVDKNRVALEFSVVPDLSQLPPFILRKSSRRSNKWSQKLQPGDALVGPVLPLPVDFQQRQKSITAVMRSYQPVAAKGSPMDHTRGKSVYKDDRFDTLISKVSDKKHVSNDNQDNVGLELFDDLCPVELRFDACSLKFEQKEWEAYCKLKGEFLKWQKSFDLYQEFCSRIESKSS